MLLAGPIRCRQRQQHSCQALAALDFCKEQYLLFGSVIYVKEGKLKGQGKGKIAHRKIAHARVTDVPAKDTDECFPGLDLQQRSGIINFIWEKGGDKALGIRSWTVPTASRYASIFHTTQHLLG